MNNDVSNIISNKNYGVFNTKSYLGSYKEFVTNRKTLYGYIQPTSDSDIARGRYNVSVIELNGAILLCRLLISPYKLGANSSKGGLARLDLHLPVVLLPLNETGDYGILDTFTPIDYKQEDLISSTILASTSEDITIPRVDTKKTDSTFNQPINRHQFELGFFINQYDTSGVTIEPFNLDKVTYSWPHMGNIQSHSANGEYYEQILNNYTTSKANSIELIDGINKNKIDKTKSELFSFYQLTKYRIANSTKRLYEYRNGKIVPGLLLNQIRRFSSNFNTTGSEIIKVIDRLTSYLNQADTLVLGVSDFIEWFDGNYVAQVTDLLSIVGLPNSLSIGNVVNLGVALDGDNPIKAEIDFNLGSKFIDSFLEGVANSLISDFIGETSLTDLVNTGLGLFGISIGGKDNPDETLEANSKNPKLPARRNKKSLLEALNTISTGAGQFSESLRNLRLLKSGGLLNLQNNGTIQLSRVNQSYLSYIDYSNLNYNPQSIKGTLAAKLTVLGLDYGAFMVESLISFCKTKNPMHLLLTILPMVSVKYRVIFILFAFYVSESEDIKLFLVKEFIPIENYKKTYSNKYYEKLISLSYTEIFFYLEEINYTEINFNQLMLNPTEELYKLNLDSELKYYWEELLSGKILNFFRGCILINTSNDITLDLDVYNKLNTLINQIYV